MVDGSVDNTVGLTTPLLSEQYISSDIDSDDRVLNPYNNNWGIWIAQQVERFHAAGAEQPTQGFTVEMMDQVLADQQAAMATPNPQSPQLAPSVEPEAG